MAKSIQIQPEEQFAREYADRLILAQLAQLQSVVKLSEIADRLQDQGIGLAAVRALLASNPTKFAYNERRWVPAARLEGLGRPLAEQARLTVERFGGPMPLEWVLSEIQLTTPHATEDAVRRACKTGPLAMTADEKVFLKNWCFAADDETPAAAYAREGVDAAEVAAVQAKLKGFNWREQGAVAKALAQVAPVSPKVLGAVAWLELNPQNPFSHQFYSWISFGQELFAVPGYEYNPGGLLSPEVDTKKWINTAIKVADKLAPTVEIEDAAPIEVKSDDVERMVKKIVGSEQSITITRLLEEFYEITPSVKTYPDDFANVKTALNGRSEVLWVGGDRFNKPSVVPELVQSVPEIFQFSYTEIKDEEGDYVDSELNDDGLSSTLRKLINHPLAMDVLDEDLMPQSKQLPETIRCVLKPIHRELGTFPLCQIPTGWLEAEPKFQELILINREGSELQVWANMEARLMFGLIDWFFEQPVESGAVFSLTRTPRANVFEFEWLDQTDPVVFITTQRMEELRDLQARSEEAGMSTYEVLREVMSHWPKGADFLTLLWEINVVRRVSRRLVASLLSSYACFYQRSGSPVWHYDSKKVEQGFDKTKRKFIVRR